MGADEEADGLRTNAYNKALSVKDEFFHSALYDWYLAHGITDQLLEASRTPLRALPTLLTFSHCFDRLGHPTSRHTFLGSPRPCRRRTFCGSTTCERRGTPTRRRSSPASPRRFCKSFGLFPGSSQAYHLFFSFPLAIHKRVEYLSLAVGNAKSQFSSNRSDSVQFLTDVEEKLEVSQVQIEIYCAIQESDLEPEAKKAMLEQVEERLYTISEVRRASLCAGPVVWLTPRFSCTPFSPLPLGCSKSTCSSSMCRTTATPRWWRRLGRVSWSRVSFVSLPPFWIHTLIFSSNFLQPTASRPTSRSSRSAPRSSPSREGSSARTSLSLFVRSRRTLYSVTC